MQTLLQCMAVQVTAEPAAAAFRNLCVRCTSKLQDSSILFSLIDAVKGLLVQGEPPLALLQQFDAVGPSSACDVWMLISNVNRLTTNRLSRMTSWSVNLHIACNV